MVVSNQYNFIFLRVPKNASTSMATWFVQNCCNHTDRYMGIGDSGTKANNINPRVIQKHRKFYHHIHMTLQEIVDEGIVTTEEALTKKVITIIRDPFARQLSLFFFKEKKYKTPQEFRKVFAKGCHETDGNNQILQSDYSKINGELAPNSDIWLYEDLKEKHANFISKNNIIEKAQVNKYKSNRRPKQDINELIKEYYDDATREAVYSYYKKDFELIKRIKESQNGKESNTT